ncbi:MAG: hypothetical protein QXW10_00890 [Candidatus Micrarchaeaceae archaeon]
MNKSDPILITVLIASAAILLVLFYMYFGPEWDLIAHYMNAKSLANPSFYGCLFSKNCVFATQDSAFYFEPFRAPLSSAFIAIFIIMAGSYALPAYVAFVFALFLASIYMLAKDMQLDLLITFSVFLSPFVLLFSLLANSTEMLSLSFAMVGIAMIARKSPWSGLFFGLASLSKYILLFSLPLLLLLRKPRKITAALVLFVLPILPWLAVNKVAFGSFIFSYTNIFSIVNASVFTTGISATALLTILSSAIAITIAAVIAMLYFGKGRLTFPAKDLRKSISNNIRIQAALLLLALSAASWLYIAYRRDVFTQTRFGYMLYGSVALCLAIIFSSAAKVKRNSGIRFVIAVISIVMIFYSAIGIWSTLGSGPALSIWNPVYSNAAHELDSLGYGNCDVVSNDWIYMLYYGVHAFSPFYMGNRYPIIVFYNSYAATNPSLIANMRNSTAVFNNGNFSVLLPSNYTCFSSGPAAAG